MYTCIYVYTYTYTKAILPPNTYNLIYFFMLIRHKNIFITSITKIAKNNCIFYIFIHQNKHTSTNKRSLKSGITVHY